MIEYSDCNVQAQPNADVEVVVAEYDWPPTSPHQDWKPTRTILRIGDLLYYRESDYGNVYWYQVDPEKEYDPEGGAPSLSDCFSCRREVEHMLEAVLTLAIDQKIGSEENWETGQPHELESNLEYYRRPEEDKGR